MGYVTGSTTATTNCRRSNLVSLFLEETGTTARFSVGDCASVCLCVCAGGQAYSKNAFVFPGLLPIAGRGGKTALFLWIFFFCVCVLRPAEARLLSTGGEKANVYLP